MQVARNQDNSIFIDKIINEALTEEVFPGCVLLISQEQSKLYFKSFGKRSYGKVETSFNQDMQLNTVFDLASITSVLVTTLLTAKLVETGLISFEDRLARYLQSFSVNNKSTITIAQLLNHTSGLPSWQPFFQQLVKDNASARPGVLASIGAKQYIYNEINRSKLKHLPGAKQIYSDLGLLALGQLIEFLTGTRLDKTARNFIFNPLKMNSTSFIDLRLIKRRELFPVEDLIAPTEDCDWRKRVLCGEVHDDNAWVMGGIAAHAGIFSCADDLNLFCNELLRVLSGKSSFINREVLELAWNYPSNFEESSWKLGFDAPSKENNYLDLGFSEDARGIDSFTGCSFWIDPKKELSITLLSNRIHPSRNNKKIKAFRRELFKTILSYC